MLLECDGEEIGIDIIARWWNVSEDEAINKIIKMDTKKFDINGLDVNILFKKEIKIPKRIKRIKRIKKQMMKLSRNKKTKSFTDLEIKK